MGKRIVFPILCLTRIRKKLFLRRLLDSVVIRERKCESHCDVQKTNSISLESSDQVFSSLSAVRSFNQPKFSPNATWNPNATTFAPNGTIGSWPRGIFITTNNTIVVPNQSTGQLLIWLDGSSNLTSIILANLSAPLSVFVNSDDQIFADNNSPNNRIDRWTLNGTQLASPMPLCSRCTGLFIDINSNLYCSQDQQHQVLRKSLSDPASAPVIIAGTGCQGSASNMLSTPNGIFVTENLDLYVADWGNDRIQLFRSGELNGTTVAGSGSTGTISLWGPTDVALDADGYLFIVDKKNNRIVGSGPFGFRCLVGCRGFRGALSYQLNSPQSMRFDTGGNIFVTDQYNNRIQKFMLLNNPSGEWKRNDRQEIDLFI